jgi:hypothetical protein
VVSRQGFGRWSLSRLSLGGILDDHEKTLSGRKLLVGIVGRYGKSLSGKVVLIYARFQPASFRTLA